MKKVSKCNECGRTLYTNDLDLCKRCFNKVGVKAMNSMEEVEEEDPLAAASAVLEGTEEAPEEAPEETAAPEENTEEQESKE